VRATLIDVYEASHHATDPQDPVDAIIFRLDQPGLTRKDLEDIIGTRSRIAEVLNRKRSLSIGMIGRLHDRLGISASRHLAISASRHLAISAESLIQSSRARTALLPYARGRDPGETKDRPLQADPGLEDFGTRFVEARSCAICVKAVRNYRIKIGY